MAIGRVHLNGATEAQVRYMAVEPAFACRGLGSRVLRALESAAIDLGAQTVILNSRRGAQGFYERHGYAVEGPAETMFGRIEHVRMQKNLRRKAV